MSVRWHRGGWWGRCLLWAAMRAGLARGISTHYASIQLNTTRAAVHGWKQAEKICVTHASSLKGQGGWGEVQRHRQKLY